MLAKGHSRHFKVLVCGHFGRGVPFVFELLLQCIDGRVEFGKAVDQSFEFTGELEALKTNSDVGIASEYVLKHLLQEWRLDDDGVQCQRSARIAINLVIEISLGRLVMKALQPLDKRFA